MKLIPPRPTFALDITASERELMIRHGEYWNLFIEKGAAIVVGPVLDPAGSWGVGVLEVVDENVAQTMADNDPAVKADAGFRTFIMPMPSALVRKAAVG